MNISRAGTGLTFPISKKYMISVYTAVLKGIAVFVIVEDRRLEENLARKERYHCHSLDAVEFEGMDYAVAGTPEPLLAAMKEDRHLYEVFRQLYKV